MDPKVLEEHYNSMGINATGTLLARHVVSLKLKDPTAFLKLGHGVGQLEALYWSTLAAIVDGNPENGAEGVEKFIKKSKELAILMEHLLDNTEPTQETH